MNPKRDIIDFEHLFIQNELPKAPDNIRGYVFSIATYLGVMFIFATILFLFLRGIPAFVELVTPEDALFEVLSEDKDAVAVLRSGAYNPSLFESLNETHTLLSSDGYDFIFHKSHIMFILEDVFILEVFNDYLDENDNVYIIYLQGSRYALIPSNDSDVSILHLPYETLTTFALSLLNFSVYVFLFIPIVLFLKTDIFYDYKHILSVRQKIIGFVLSGYIYVFLGNFLASTLMSILQTLTSQNVSTSINQTVIIEMLSSNGFILTFISAVFIGPIVEELIFRKAFFGIIKHKYIALVSSSVIFGVIHVTSESSFLISVIQVIPYIAIGFVFGFLYLKHHKNIMIPIFVHMLSNFISIMLAIFII